MLALAGANGVIKLLESLPLIKRMETPVHPSAIRSKTPSQKWQIFSVAANGVNKTSETPSVNRRMETLVHPSAIRSKTPSQKWQIFSVKLEEKFNEKDAQKVQLQTTLKEKAESKFRRLRQSFCFKARPLLNFYNERATPKSPLKMAANGVNKTSKTPLVKRRMETSVHPLAVRSKTPGQKWQIFSAVSKSLSAYKNKLQSPTIPSPFTFRTEERAARRKQARANICSITSLQGVVVMILIDFNSEETAVPNYMRGRSSEDVITAAEDRIQEKEAHVRLMERQEAFVGRVVN
ncbi:WVD2-like protein 7 [Tanacetum coccineum]